MAPEIAARGARLVVVGPARVEHIRPFREATGYDGAILVDPSLSAFEVAGLVRGPGRTFHPRSLLQGLMAFARGFRQGARRGDPYQQGGTFVLGPGAVVRYAWRDRFAGDLPVLADVLAALP